MYPIRKLVASAAIAVAAVGGGAVVGAGMLGTASAATSDTTTTTTAATPSASVSDTAPAHDPSKGGHRANGKTEVVLTGDDLAKATAAAKAAVPTGTVERAETDAEGAAFEVHMTKADGSDVTVKLDSAFKVLSTLDGHA